MNFGGQHYLGLNGAPCDLKSMGGLNPVGGGMPWNPPPPPLCNRAEGPS